ncbi:hypothetical protein DJ021_01620 [Phenylobacterium hankyongense]|uniref:Uncharacterized protein n=1 Tax=Phenylobacterium hankyongense TaxID=1813876 RepID=A0A328AYA4_9CAUL|nr:hypothetical protein DJ021_01620 [Phenylobacterium hankyongense]
MVNEGLLPLTKAAISADLTLSIVMAGLVPATHEHGVGDLPARAVFMGPRDEPGDDEREEDYSPSWRSSARAASAGEAFWRSRSTL